MDRKKEICAMKVKIDSCLVWLGQGDASRGLEPASEVLEVLPGAVLASIQTVHGSLGNLKR